MFTIYEGKTENKEKKQWAFAVDLHDDDFNVYAVDAETGERIALLFYVEAITGELMRNCNAGEDMADYDTSNIDLTDGGYIVLGE